MGFVIVRPHEANNQKLMNMLYALNLRILCMEAEESFSEWSLVVDEIPESTPFPIAKEYRSRGKGKKIKQWQKQY